MGPLISHKFKYTIIHPKRAENSVFGPSQLFGMQLPPLHGKCLNFFPIFWTPSLISFLLTQPFLDILVLYCSLHFDDISHTRHFSLAMSISLFDLKRKTKYSAIVTSFKGENLKSTHFHNEKSFASHGLIFFPCLSFIKLKIRRSPQNMDWLLIILIPYSYCANNLFKYWTEQFDSIS